MSHSARGTALFRSLMFVPGNSEKMLTKAIGLENLDLAMFDLEDGVPPALKGEARALVAAMLAAPPGGPARFVRINAIGTDRMEADLAAILVSGLEGLVLPKVETVDEVLLVDRLLAEREPVMRLSVGSIRFIVTIESARGLLNAPAIAACSRRVLALMFGAEDYGLDLGLPPIREGEARELLYARSALVIAAASAHIQSIDRVWPEIRDFDGLRADAIQARRLGFTAKSTFHPVQIDILNEVFSPTPSDVEYATRLVAAFDAAQAAGQGSIAFGGQLLDLPIVERARRILQRQEAVSRATR